MTSAPSKRIFNIIVVAAALGYFVDIYDLILFGVVKNPSLIDLGITNKDALFSQGNYLLSMQMAGMLIGGIIWGILSDKKGRMSILFLTIFLYSIANIANGFAQNVQQYAILRFIAGFGLSGELGIGITMVSEVMTKEARGLGASIVSGIGIAGSVLAFIVAEKFNWRVAFWTGGGLGMLLLFLRMAVYESGMYEKTKAIRVSKGNFFSLFANIKRFKKFILIILMAIPTWYAVSILTINAPSFAQDALHITGVIKGSTSVMMHYIGAAIGSFLFGYLSLKLKSRKKPLIISIVSMIVLTIIYFSLKGASPELFYSILLLLGIPMGVLWTGFVTTASEQYGTNLRATVTTSAPNFVRGSTILMTFMLGTLTSFCGIWNAGVIIGIIFITIALVSVFFIEETYGKELDYVEDV